MLCVNILSIIFLKNDSGKIHYFMEFLTKYMNKSMAIKINTPFILRHWISWFFITCCVSQINEIKIINGKLAYTVQGIQRIIYTYIVFDPNVPKFTLVYDCQHFMTIFTCVFCQVNNHIYIKKNDNASVRSMIILFVIAITELLMNYINCNQFKQDNESVCLRGFLQSI